MSSVFAGKQYTKKSMLPPKELERLAGEADSGICKVQDEIHIALPAKYLNDMALGLVTFFNKQVNSYHPKLNGILAGYGKLQLLTNMGRVINEEPQIHVDVRSEFWVFRPEVGCELRGVVTKKSPSHISCLVHGVFNVPCHKPTDHQGDSWANNVKVNSQVKLKVVKTDMSQRIPYILGSYVGVVRGKKMYQHVVFGSDNEDEKDEAAATGEGSEPKQPEMKSPAPKKATARKKTNSTSVSNEASPAAAQLPLPVASNVNPTALLPTSPLPIAPSINAQLPQEPVLPGPVPAAKGKRGKKAAAATAAAVPSLPPPTIATLQQPLPVLVTPPAATAVPATPPAAKGKREKAVAGAAAAAAAVASAAQVATGPPKAVLDMIQTPPTAAAALPNIPGMLSNLTPVKPSSPRKSPAKKKNSIPENIAAVVDNVVNAVTAAPAAAVVEPDAQVKDALVAAAVASSSAPTKKSKKKKKDAAAAAAAGEAAAPAAAQLPAAATALATPARAVAVAFAAQDVQTPVNGFHGGLFNSTEVATPSAAAETQQQQKKKKKKKRHISEVSDPTPVTPIAQTTFDTTLATPTAAAATEGEFADPPKKKKKKDKNREAEAETAAAPETTQTEAEVTSSESKKSKKKKKKKSHDD